MQGDKKNQTAGYFFFKLFPVQKKKGRNELMRTFHSTQKWRGFFRRETTTEKRNGGWKLRFGGLSLWFLIWILIFFFWWVGGGSFGRIKTRFGPVRHYVDRQNNALWWARQCQRPQTVNLPKFLGDNGIWKKKKPKKNQNGPAGTVAVKTAVLPIEIKFSFVDWKKKQSKILP